jgi:hypothetical protein
MNYYNKYLKYKNKYINLKKKYISTNQININKTTYVYKPFRIDSHLPNLHV